MGVARNNPDVDLRTKHIVLPLFIENQKRSNETQ